MLAQPLGRGTALRAGILTGLCVVAALDATLAPARAQTFSSGSDGSDGAFNVPPNQGVVIFDPFDTALWGRVLDTDGDGVYNFTTISVGSGTTLKLRGDRVNRPMYWLASGDVTISGALDLNGENGLITDLTTRREVAVPGSGGYAGGAGGFTTPPVPATAGEGPGGGQGGRTDDCVGSGLVKCGLGGVFSGAHFLLPITGGSGGEGAIAAAGQTRTSNGGAGGGAIVIVSASSITLTGEISANGGRGADFPPVLATGAGGGSGGGVRLVAPAMLGSGTISVRGGDVVNPVGGRQVIAGGAGWVRLESSQGTPAFTINPAVNAVSHGWPGDVSTFRPPVSIRVAAVDGILLPANPSGMFRLPDVIINRTGPVDVQIAATGIPVGTKVTLQVYAEAPLDPLTLNLVVEGTLEGTTESSTMTVPMTFPFGFSRGWVRARWP